MQFLPDTPPTHTVLQLSDLHVVPEGELFNGIDTLGNVAAAFDQIERSGVAADALLLSGDLADGGDLASYRRLRELVERRAGALRLPVLYLMGNHDNRGPFREALLGAAPSDEPCDVVHWAGGLRIIGLDSSRPGTAVGQLSGAQLAWLAAQLATPAPAGTILAVHHPPLPSPIALMRALALAEPERLGAVIAGTDVRIVLAGHSHHASGGVLAGVPVWVCGATSSSSYALAAPGRYTAVTGGLFTRVDVYPGQAVATALPLPPGETVFELTPDLLASG
jgi:3',5'-cyclic AMP phosphodiesterase CpdA